MNDTQTIATLKSLHLSAMADVYEASLRLGPSEAQTIGELLAQMAEAEWNARQQRRTERLLKKASLRMSASLDELEFSPERKLDRGVIQQLSTLEWITRGSTILITGFQAAGTLGRRLVDGARRVRLLGEDVPVKADLYTLGGLSAHADRAALLNWLGRFRAPPRHTFVMHGEAETATGFAAHIEEKLGWRAEAPQAGQRVVLS